MHAAFRCRRPCVAPTPGPSSSEPEPSVMPPEDAQRPNTRKGALHTQSIQRYTYARLSAHGDLVAQKNNIFALSYRTLDTAVSEKLFSKEACRILKNSGPGRHPLPFGCTVVEKAPPLKVLAFHRQYARRAHNAYPQKPPRSRRRLPPRVHPSSNAALRVRDGQIICFRSPSRAISSPYRGGQSLPLSHCPTAGPISTFIFFTDLHNQGCPTVHKTKNCL